MSDFPYTDEQVEAYRKAAGWGTLTPDTVTHHLAVLHEAGIKVQFPEPRFRVLPAAGGFIVKCRDEVEDWAWEARFNGPHAETYAREHAERLNREAQA